MVLLSQETGNPADHLTTSIFEVLYLGFHLDVLGIKLKDSSKHKNLLKRCDELIKEVENYRQIGKAARRH